MNSTQKIPRDHADRDEIIMHMLRNHTLGTSGLCILVEQMLNAQDKQQQSSAQLPMSQVDLDRNMREVLEMSQQLENGLVNIVSFLDKCVEMRAKIGNNTVLTDLMCPQTGFSF